MSSFFYSSSFRAWLVLILKALLASNLNLQLPCLPTIRSELSTTDFMVQLSIVIGPALAIPSNIFTRFLSDRYAAKYLFISCVLLFSFGSLICALSNNIIFFLMGRSLQVLGDAGVSILGFVILSDLFPHSLSLGRYLGFNSILSSLAIIPSPLIGAWILTHYHWRWIFLLLFAFSVILFLLFLWCLDEKSNKKKENLSFSFLAFFQETHQLFKIPLFFLGTVIPALYMSLASLFDLYTTFLCIDSFGLTPSEFSLFRVVLILLSALASAVYLYMLSYGGIEGAFSLGFLGYLMYILILLSFYAIFPLANNYYNAFFLFCLPAMLGISLAFIDPISMLKILSCSQDKKEAGLSVFALTRNVFSTFFLLLGTFFFNGAIYSTTFIVFFISFSILALLFFMKNFIKSY